MPILSFESLRFLAPPVRGPPTSVLAKMHFSVLALIALPFLADALENGLSIPISKRSVLHDADGHIDITTVQASQHHAIEFVSVILFKEKV